MPKHGDIIVSGKIENLSEEKPFQHRDFVGDTQNCIVGHNVLGEFRSFLLSLEMSNYAELRPFDKLYEPYKNHLHLVIKDFSCTHPRRHFWDSQW